MSDYFSDKDKYTYPNTSVLRNLFDIKDSIKLEEVEKKLTAMRIFDIQPLIEKETPSFRLLWKIHKVLFQDVYSWAGKIREVQLSKGNTLFAHPEFIKSQATEIFSHLKKEKFLRELSKEDFCKRLAYYYNELNIVHPFREGNGRVLKFLVSSIVFQAGFQIDWSKINLEDHLKSCILAYQKSDISFLTKDFLKIVFNKKEKTK